MIILGAGGHARDLYDLMSFDEKPIYFFDDYTRNRPKSLFDRPILSNLIDAMKILDTEKKVVIGTGGGIIRHAFYEKFIELGADFVSVIAPSAIISKHSCNIDKGVNIMNFSFISNHTFIGFGTLINSRVDVHHNVKIGNFCEIAPGSILLGNVHVGDFSFIGAGAVILPGVHIGKHCVIGAGAVVTKSIPDYSKVKGLPAK